MNMSYQKKIIKGIMFHYFHDKKFFKSTPGSIDSDYLVKIIKKIGQTNILDPLEFIEKIKNRNIKPNQTCFTFDDSLKCQYKIALPILKKFKIKSFFFITTSIFTKKPNLMEINRFFRDNFYKSLKAFYSEFYYELFKFFPKNKIKRFIERNSPKISEYKKIYPFYNLEDLKFRYIRDQFLKKNEYDMIMKLLFKKKRFNYKKKIKDLYMNKNDIKKISKEGHLIGLHSHQHHSSISNLSFQKQKRDFSTNKKILEKIISKQIISASYPRGDYNVNTLKVLKQLKIEIAFKDNAFKISKIHQIKKLEIPRVDHHQI
tara:strand:- start:1460 stop:2407 length:948 start_codon:yes stop_codon:yes gene_type:complete